MQTSSDCQFHVWMCDYALNYYCALHTSCHYCVAYCIDRESTLINISFANERQNITQRQMLQPVEVTLSCWENQPTGVNNCRGCSVHKWGHQIDLENWQRLSGCQLAKCRSTLARKWLYMTCELTVFLPHLPDSEDSFSCYCILNIHTSCHRIWVKDST